MSAGGSRRRRADWIVRGIRLQKVLARAGVASRRAAEELIRQGRVAVNGQVVRDLGSRVDPVASKIVVDGVPLAAAPPLVYLLFNKPRNCVTSLRDPQGRRTVLDFLPGLGVRVFPVGRLDYDAEGLLLLTNDGTWANRLQHPRYGVPKTYEVKLKGKPDEKTLSRLRSGVPLKEGVTAPAEVEVLRVLPQAAWVKMVIHQGWNRQIKRMGEFVGHPVLKIKRVAYGDLRLGEIPPGGYRTLHPWEVKRLCPEARPDDGQVRER